MTFRASAFDYDLPSELVAQEPLPDRSASRLLVLGRVKFVGALDARATVVKYGEVPLPPYIRRAPTAADRARYQTVYAEHDGSVAAPTAGLHFTPALLDRLRAKGTAIATLDLHIGPGTFKPVEVDDLARHRMEPERSEEHTSELQSQSNLVCPLLLEKKNAR